MFELKPLSSQGLPAALERAQRYRLLNEPAEAESICLDVLAVEPANQDALKTLLLALTDQFDEHLGPAFQRAREVLADLEGAYARAYYEGIICERRAKTHFRRGGPGSGHVAYDWFRQAMDLYDSAAKERPGGNEESILRWNACARVLMHNPHLEPAPADTFQPLLE